MRKFCNLIFKTHYKVIFISLIFYYVFLFDCFNMVTIAQCCSETQDIASSLPQPASVNSSPNMNFKDLLPLAVVFGGANAIFRGAPANVRVLGASAVVTTTFVTRAFKKVIQYRSDSLKLPGNSSSSGSQEGFSATSPIENSFLNTTEPFSYFLCFLLLILSLIIFTILISWVISNKHTPVLTFLNKTTTFKKLLGNYFEQVKSISVRNIFLLILFFYLNLSTCIYILLYYF